jgi:hypothetical protein
MLDKLKKLGEKTINSLSSAAEMVSDLNGDGKVDEEDARIALEWTKKAASSIGDEASRLSKEALRSDMAKDAASGAAVGAVVAVPIPIIGPMAGAAIGAGVGIYKNLTKKGATASPSYVPESKTQIDVYGELLKLDDLRQKNIISEAEFEVQKKKVLDSRA